MTKFYLVDSKDGGPLLVGADSSRDARAKYLRSVDRDDVKERPTVTELSESRMQEELHLTWGMMEIAEDDPTVGFNVHFDPMKNEGQYAEAFSKKMGILRAGGIVRIE